MALVLRKLNFGPSFGAHQNLVSSYCRKAVWVLLVPYGVLTVSAVFTGTVSTAWFYAQALLIGALVFASLVGGKSESKLLGIVLAVPIVMMIMSMLVNGSMPMGQDEGKFTGFAYIILRDGKWQSGVFVENNYYQFFHVVPSVIATISMVTGLDIVYLVHPLTALVTTFVVNLDIYLVLRNLKEMGGLSVGLLGPILLLSTPPVSTSAFIPQVLAVAFYLTALALLSVETEGRFYHVRLLALFLISVIGVVTHAAYPILLLSTLIPTLIASSNRQNRTVRSRFLRDVVSFVLVFTFVYWTYTLILDQLVGTSGSWVHGLIVLLMGGAQPFTAGRQSWYSGVSAEIAYSWVFLLALAGAYLFAQLFGDFVRLRSVVKVFRDLKADWVATLGIVGILWLGLALVLRASYGGWGVRYFYPFYILLIPASVLMIRKIVENRKIVSVLAIVVMVCFASFYALHDPMRSVGNSEGFLVASRRTWTIAETLASKASLRVYYVLDPRISIPFTALTLQTIPALHYIKPDEPYATSVFVVNLDDLGSQWFNSTLDVSVRQQIVNRSYDLIYTDGLYQTYYQGPGT